MSSSSDESDEYFQYERQFGINSLPTKHNLSPYESSIISIDSDDSLNSLTLPNATSFKEELSDDSLNCLTLPNAGNATSFKEELSDDSLHCLTLPCAATSFKEELSDDLAPQTPAISASELPKPRVRRKPLKNRRVYNLKKGQPPSLPKPKQSSDTPQPKRIKVARPESAVFEEMRFPREVLPYSVKVKTGDKIVERALLTPQGNQIFNLSILSNVFALFKCTQSQCPGRPKFYQSANKDGIQRFFTIKCYLCHTCIASFPATLPIGASPDKVVNNKSAMLKGKSELNKQCMLAVHTTSMSWTDFVLANSLMNLPKPHLDMCPANLDALVDVSRNIASRSMQQHAEAVRHKSTANVSSMPGVVRCNVSFDATWHQRGHYSNQGFAAVIESTLGKVIDYVVYDRVCSKCTKWPKERREQEPEGYSRFLTEHKSHCQANYNGTSQSMESSAAIEMWGRSIEKNQLMYETYIGDGDSSSFKNLLKSDPYKGECIVRKEECLGHVQKRFKNCLKANRSGSKGLSEVKGDHLAGLYRLVVIQNRGRTGEDIQKGLEVLLQHCIGQHTSCPIGTTSWCPDQKRIAADSSNAPVKPRKSYLTEEEGTRLREALAVYGTLSFCKCLTLGTTQNANESLHSMLWHNAPKGKKIGQKSLQASAALAVLSFNEGSLSYSSILDAQGINLSHNSLQYLTARDKERLRKRICRVSAPQKKRRRELAARATCLEASRKRKSKGASYNSGQFGVELDSGEES